MQFHCKVVQKVIEIILQCWDLVCDTYHLWRSSLMVIHSDSACGSGCIHTLDQFGLLPLQSSWLQVSAVSSEETQGQNWNPCDRYWSMTFWRGPIPLSRVTKPFPTAICYWFATASVVESVFLVTTSLRKPCIWWLALHVSWKISTRLRFCSDSLSLFGIFQLGPLKVWNWNILPHCPFSRLTFSSLFYFLFCFCTSLYFCLFEFYFYLMTVWYYLGRGGDLEGWEKTWVLAQGPCFQRLGGLLAPELLFSSSS